MRVYVRSFVVTDSKGQPVTLHLFQQYLPQTQSKFWKPDAVPGVMEFSREDGTAVEYKSKGQYIARSGEMFRCDDKDAP